MKNSEIATLTAFARKDGKGVVLVMMRLPRLLCSLAKAVKSKLYHLNLKSCVEKLKHSIATVLFFNKK